MKRLKLLLIALFPFLLLASAQAGPRDARGFIRDELLKGLPWDRESVQIEEIEAPGLDSARYDSIRLDVPKRISSPGKVSFLLEFRLKGAEARTVWGTARVKVFRDAVIALKPLKGRTRITEGDLSVARVGIEEAGESFSSAGEVAGMVAQRPISAGSVVKKSYVRPEVLVKRGERVALRIEGSRMTVRSTGVAAEDGLRGATVAVKTASGREVLGTVAGPGEIVINF